MQYSTCFFILKSTSNGGQIYLFGQIVTLIIYVAFAKVLNSALQTEDGLKDNEIHEYCRNTNGNIPKTTTGLQAASNKATCCVPNGVGVGR